MSSTKPVRTPDTLDFDSEFHRILGHKRVNLANLELRALGALLRRAFELNSTHHRTLRAFRRRCEEEIIAVVASKLISKYGANAADRKDLIAILHVEFSRKEIGSINSAVCRQLAEQAKARRRTTSGAIGSTRAGTIRRAHGRLTPRPGLQEG